MSAWESPLGAKYARDMREDTLEGMLHIGQVRWSYAGHMQAISFSWRYSQVQCGKWVYKQFCSFKGISVCAYEN